MKMFGMGNYMGYRYRKHKRNKCGRRNCYIMKQQNKLQSLMGDLIFKSIAMAPPIDITDPKFKGKENHYDRMTNKFPAFIQGDVGRLRRRRRNLLSQTTQNDMYHDIMIKETNRRKRGKIKGNDKYIGGLLLILFVAINGMIGCFYWFGEKYIDKHKEESMNAIDV